jgi:hypothetical protein
MPTDPVTTGRPLQTLTALRELIRVDYFTRPVSREIAP